MNRRDLDAIERNMGPAFLDHDGPGGQDADRAVDRAMMGKMHETSTNAETAVATQFHGFVMSRVTDGKIVER